MKGSSFIQGFWTGLGLGVLAGLMNAKRPGHETRQLLRLKIDRTSQDVHDLRFSLDNLSQSIQHLSKEGILSVNEAVEAVSESLKHFQEENQPRLKRVKAQVNQLTDTLQSEKEKFTKEV
ncbi:YtxH domain-containing protein [Facklamia hominis]|uniref:YtxH domain-containing protein n=1 Tax=Facklamia hominis CCUG 36813 TaxID=883111 RepID=K1LCS8_9LACT|nr:YtxH domain-containing protein [Facklamia hominis]EKB54430.1 hypothetical protein HMPREF9706_00620 [Facklamia hominis CCUG 36813]